GERLALRTSARGQPQYRRTVMAAGAAQQITGAALLSFQRQMGVKKRAGWGGDCRRQGMVPGHYSNRFLYHKSAGQTVNMHTGRNGQVFTSFTNEITQARNTLAGHSLLGSLRKTSCRATKPTSCRTRSGISLYKVVCLQKEIPGQA